MSKQQIHIEPPPWATHRERIAYIEAQKLVNQRQPKDDAEEQFREETRVMKEKTAAIGEMLKSPKPIRLWKHAPKYLLAMGLGF